MMPFFWSQFFFIFDLKWYLFIRLIYYCDTSFIFIISSKFDYSTEILYIRRKLIFITPCGSGYEIKILV